MTTPDAGASGLVTRAAAASNANALIRWRSLSKHISPDDERLEVICADGAEYVVKGHDARPGVILVDGFLAHGMPAQLGNAVFSPACHARLSGDEVWVANFVGDDPQGDLQCPGTRTRRDARAGPRC